MRKALITAFIFCFVLVISLPSCKKDSIGENFNTGKKLKPVLPATPYDYNALLINNEIPVSHVDNKLASLGRVLFYDTKLSINNSTSCASCHKQHLAFSDDVAFSPGFVGEGTLRNSMPVFNLSSNSGFFWDLRTADLETMVLEPVENHIEMGFEKLDHLILKLANTSYYPELYEFAFGSVEITEKRTREALAEFLKALKTGNSVYDKARNNKFINFPYMASEGLSIFNQNACNSCHSGEGFSGTWNKFANIGLEMEYKDKGMERVAEEGVFKIPSLRNIALTAPYMHDGRFKTLEEVIEHYNSGIVNHPNLHWNLQNITRGSMNMPTPRRMNLTDFEKAALKAFLESLTDYEFIRDEKYSNPFRLVD